ncbi:unnamed protein product [Coregonus sp. 'balchen']|nr:unnamed protein product [Coregonus sp. 'balchen']
MATYLLLSLRMLSRVVEGFGLMKWLSQKRNHLGGYGSTQDTVMALQAFGSHLIHLHITVNRAPSTTVANFHINYTNYLLYQSQELFGTDMYYVHLYICISSLLEGQAINQTGMAILEVGLLNGFILAQAGIETNDVVRRVETPPENVILYLDSVTTEEMCVEIPSVIAFKVANIKDATLLLYGYY